MSTKFSQLIAGVLGLGLLVSVHAETPTSTIQIEEPYALAVPPGQPNGAAYMTLHNSGTTAQTLVAAESPVAKSVELHTHTMADGMMQMRQIESIEVPAGEHVTLKPGELHLMLIDLNHALKSGEQIAITLIYADGARQTVEAPVREISDAMEHQHNNHEHHEHHEHHQD